MPIARFQMPDGRIARFEVPDGTTPEQAQEMIAQAMPDVPAAASKDTRGKFDLRGEMYDRTVNYDPRNAIGGQIRGAGSIGATLIRPFESAQENQQRRSAMDEALTGLVGSDPKSTAYQVNKTLAEIAGTSGVGGAIANVVGRIPGAAAALPTLLPAIQSGGMSANGARGLYGMANRIAGGAVTGAATAGLVDPSQADTGAMIGAATPAAVKLAGTVGGAARNAVMAEPLNPVLQQTARESIDAGYVIPPNMVAPSLKSQVVESVSGKQATQQIASTRNTQNTERIVREALGIPEAAPLTKGTLEDLRKTAGKTYAEVASLSPQAASDLEALKVARNEAKTWFDSYNRTASPEALAKAKEFRGQAENLENWLEFHAADAGKSELIPALQKARKEIAKTYTVGRALNDAAGTVDARVLGRMYEKGVPLSDGLETAGRFASAFPSIAKSPQQVGSPAAHNLKAFGSMLLGGGGYAALGPAGAAAAAVPFLAGPAARSIMFSRPVQRALASEPATGGLLSQAIDETLPLLYRTAPLLGTRQ